MPFKGLLLAARCLQALLYDNNSVWAQNGSAHLGIWSMLVMLTSWRCFFEGYGCRDSHCMKMRLSHLKMWSMYYFPLQLP